MNSENPYLEIDQKMVGDIYTSREVMENLTVLCDDFGSRFAGTPGEEKAAHFIKEAMESYGLENVHFHEYNYPGWTRGKATLQIIEPIEREIDCISLPYCPADEIVGELVLTGCGTPEEFDKRASDIKGNLVMASSCSPGDYDRWLHRKEKYARSVLFGAGAFLYVNETPGLGPQTGSLLSGRPAPIPGVSLGYEDGQFLERLSRRKGPIRLRLVTTDSTAPRKAKNILGEIKGQSHPDEIVLLCSHYDGHDIAQGALDPASGMVTVLEAARVLAKYGAEKLGCTVRFIAWGTEEIGLIGSYKYAEEHSENMDQIRFVFNLDSAGALSKKDLVLHQWPELEEFFSQTIDEITTDTTLGQKLNAYSDHFPFFLQGVPTGEMGDLRSNSPGRGYTHSPFDTLDKVELSSLREASALAARLALRIGAAEQFPAQRRPEEMVQTLVKEDSDLESYRVQKKLEERLGK